MFGEFGKYLGIAFQIIDDMLDYFGNSSKTKKIIGNDYKEGKITLPIIYAMKNCDSDKVRDIFTSGEKFDEILHILHDSDTESYCKSIAAECCDKAKNIISHFKTENNVAKQNILDLINFCLQRTF